MRRRPALWQRHQLPHRGRAGAFRRVAGCRRKEQRQAQFAPADGRQPNPERRLVMSIHDTGSVRSKLILMAVATTVVALLSAAIAMILVDLRTFQRVWVDDLSTQADIVANVAAPALSFND